MPDANSPKKLQGGIEDTNPDRSMDKPIQTQIEIGTDLKAQEKEPEKVVVGFEDKAEATTHIVKDPKTQEELEVTLESKPMIFPEGLEKVETRHESKSEGGFTPSPPLPPQGVVEVKAPEKPAPPDPFVPSLPMDQYLDPGRTNQMYFLANTYFKSNCFTNDCKNVEQVFVKIQAGRELGLNPMESMNDLYILHGNVTLWGAGLAKRFRRFGYKIEFKDEISNFDYTSTRGVKKNTADYKYDSPQSQPTVEKRKLAESQGEDQVTVVVTKMNDPDEKYEYKVLLSEVEALKSNALNIARKDKLRYHGLARIARFNLPELLGGIHYIAEEVTPEMAPPVLDVIENGKAKKEALRAKKQ